jgi:hypothetical protein
LNPSASPARKEPLANFGKVNEAGGRLFAMLTRPKKKDAREQARSREADTRHG